MTINKLMGKYKVGIRYFLLGSGGKENGATLKYPSKNFCKNDKALGNNINLIGSPGLKTKSAVFAGVFQNLAREIRPFQNLP